MQAEQFSSLLQCEDFGPEKVDFEGQIFICNYLNRNSILNFKSLITITWSMIASKNKYIIMLSIESSYQHSDEKFNFHLSTRTHELHNDALFASIAPNTCLNTANFIRENTNIFFFNKFINKKMSNLSNY